MCLVFRVSWNHSLFLVPDLLSPVLYFATSHFSSYLSAPQTGQTSAYEKLEARNVGGMILIHTVQIKLIFHKIKYKMHLLHPATVNLAVHSGNILHL